MDAMGAKASNRAHHQPRKGPMELLPGKKSRFKQGLKLPSSNYQ
jgi:hypothetical protein